MIVLLDFKWIQLSKVTDFAAIHPSVIAYLYCWATALSIDLPSPHKPNPCPAALALSSVVCEIRMAERPQASPFQPHDSQLTWYSRPWIWSSKTIRSVA